MHAVLPAHREILHAHLFAGLGGGARSFNRATTRVGNLTASFRCLGGIDVDAAALSDFERLAGVRSTCLDLFNREQYRACYGAEPAPGWREASVADVMLSSVPIWVRPMAAVLSVRTPEDARP